MDENASTSPLGAVFGLLITPTIDDLDDETISINKDLLKAIFGSTPSLMIKMEI